MLQILWTLFYEEKRVPGRQAASSIDRGKEVVGCESVGRRERQQEGVREAESQMNRRKKERKNETQVSWEEGAKEAESQENRKEREREKQGVSKVKGRSGGMRQRWCDRIPWNWFFLLLLLFRVF